MLFKCMDGTIRNLAGLHGTYWLIPQTDDAIILDECNEWFNLVKYIVDMMHEDYPYIDLIPDERSY